MSLDLSKIQKPATHTQQNPAPALPPETPPAQPATQMQPAPVIQIPEQTDGILGHEELWRDWTASIEPAHAPIFPETETQKEETKSEPSQTTQTQTQPAPGPPAESAEEGSKWLKYLPWIAAGILAAGGIFLAVKSYLARREEDDSESYDQPQQPPPDEPPTPRGYVVP